MVQKDKKLIIYGDSKYAEMIANLFINDSPYEVVAFCVDKEYKTRDKIDGIKVFNLEDINRHFSKEHYIFSAIGYKSVRTHKILYKKIAALSYPVASYVSSKAMIDSSSKIAQNCLILSGVIVEPNVDIKENCFINSGVIICHDAKIKEHSILAAGSIIGGYASVGESSLIGFNSTVTELVNVADETLLGAGSVLLNDTQEATLYLGTPAKAIRTHKDTGIVLEPQKS